MFGSKKQKLERHRRIIELLRAHPDGLTVQQIADTLRVPNSTIQRDLPLLEDHGCYLAEERGKLSIYKINHSFFAIF